MTRPALHVIGTFRRDGSLPIDHPSLRLLPKPYHVARY
jgi:hypothetical protein